MITLRYKPKSINYNLIFGIIWLSLGIARVTLVQKDNFFFYGFIVFGICYLTMYFVMEYKQYATITDEVITKNGLLSKSILVKNITEIKEFAGDVIFKSAEKEITINTNFITEQSATQLKEYVHKFKTARILTN